MKMKTTLQEKKKKKTTKRKKKEKLLLSLSIFVWFDLSSCTFLMMLMCEAMNYDSGD